MTDPECNILKRKIIKLSKTSTPRLVDLSLDDFYYDYAYYIVINFLMYIYTYMNDLSNNFKVKLFNCQKSYIIHKTVYLKY